MKNKPKLIIVLFLLAFFNQIIAQNCDCESNFNWVKKTFEENDAGFKYVIDQKGENQYLIHNHNFSEKAKATKNINECNGLLYNWLTFFRKGHIGINSIKKNDVEKTTDKKPNAEVDNWQSLNVNITEFEQYLKSKKETDFEGIWETKPYKIGIKKEGQNYLGFIIESEVQNWKKGQIKIKIDYENQSVKSTFYLRDKTPEQSISVNLIGNNYLQIGNKTLKRLNPILPTDKYIEDSFKSLLATKPYLEELNKTTLILRIPSFGGSKKEIDSVIKINKSKILKTENLIIDLRNNGGGNDSNFQEILPFLYTNPIKSIGTEFYSTKLNNQRMLDFVNKPEYGFGDDEKKWAKKGYDKLQLNLGKFISIDDDEIEKSEVKKIFLNPKNVGIIVNDRNASTTEEFLLIAKQSKKVKLFGTTTFGALDISNMYFVKSPCEEFELGYCLTKSLRIPDMAIDSKGIQPDYYLDKSIPIYKWIEHTNEILNAK